MKSVIIILFVFLFSAFAVAQDVFDPGVTGRNIRLTRVCDGVVQAGIGWDMVTAFATENGIVVIDAGISPSLTARYRMAIESAFNSTDFAYLINTHSHPDHTAGNQVFADAVIVGHAHCLTDIPANWQDTARVRSRLSKTMNEYRAQLDTLVPGSGEWEEAMGNKIIYENAWQDVSGGLTVTLPAFTFTDTLTLRLGGMTFDCLYFGRAHSNSDILIHIPEKKILMVGDLFSQYGRTYFRRDETADAEKWIYALDWIKSRQPQIDIIISGHGEILTSDDLEAFDRIVRKKWREM